MRALLFLSLFFINLYAFSQYKSGYLGHKYAIGFQAHYKAPLNVKNIGLKLERTLGRNISVEASGYYFKNTFYPKLRTQELMFITSNGERFYVKQLDGIITYSGRQINLGFNLYSEYYGAIAPYGKRLGAGLYFNQSTVTKSDIIYLLADNIENQKLEAEYHAYSLTNYSLKKIWGVYIDLGEKRRLKDQLYFQYNFQLNIPFSNNYLKSDFKTYNHWDYTERKMENKIMFTNFLSFSLGIGILI